VDVLGSNPSRRTLESLSDPPAGGEELATLVSSKYRSLSRIPLSGIRRKVRYGGQLSFPTISRDYSFLLIPRSQEDEVGSPPVNNKILELLFFPA